MAQQLLTAKDLPKTIKVLGAPIRVVLSPSMAELGSFNSDTFIISIHPKQSRAAAHSTLFHEAIHAALFISGLTFLLSEDLEEAVVRLVEHAVQFSPQLSELIQESTNDK